jgi:hypothetical protein
MCISTNHSCFIGRAHTALDTLSTVDNEDASSGSSLQFFHQVYSVARYITCTISLQNNTFNWGLEECSHLQCRNESSFHMHPISNSQCSEIITHPGYVIIFHSYIRISYRTFRWIVNSKFHMLDNKCSKITINNFSAYHALINTLT